MIVPGDFTSFRANSFYKLSWVVLFLNVFVYIGIIYFFEAWPSVKISDHIFDKKFKKSIFEMYVQTLDPIEKRNMDSIDAIYAKALKDEKFWNRVDSFPFRGDQVEIDDVKVTMTEFYKSYRKSPQYLLGLGSFEISPWSWLTYQFVHASFLHLFGNLMIIFLIISYLEKTVATIWLSIVYLFSGFVGGIFFLLIDSSGTMSVVGASASASGLLGFLLILQSNKLMPWFYVIAPVKGGFGKIYLPVFFIFPIFLMSDFVGLLSESNGVSTNIAISAHVGGTLTGMLLGAIFLLFGRKSTTHSIFSDYDGFHKLP